jgi:serine/threonine-protein kinase HipA
MCSEGNTLYVYVPWAGDHALAGKLTLRDEAGDFTYAPSWIDAEGYALDPLNLPVVPGPQIGRGRDGVHGVFLDAGPDSWGKRLIERERGARVLDNPLELLRLSNGGGTGGLLFSQSLSRPAPGRSAIAMTHLAELEDAARAIAAGDKVSHAALQLVFAHGSALGGARPKATVESGGREWIAKFSQPDDPVDMPRLEWACLRLARRCGIPVPDHELVDLNGRAALLVVRFDRTPAGPLHYVSLNSLFAMERVTPADVKAPTGTYTYFGGAALYRRAGVPKAGERMFERMLFNVSIGNTDDHARNHGLVHCDGAWDMTPAFDLVAYGASKHSLGIGTAGRDASIENAMSAPESYGIKGEAALAVLDRIDAELSNAPEVFAQAGLRGGDLDVAMGRLLHR